MNLLKSNKHYSNLPVSKTSQKSQNITKITLKTLLIWSISDFPGNSGFCVSSSPKMHPTDHMSMAVEYSCKEGK